MTRQTGEKLQVSFIAKGRSGPPYWQRRRRRVLAGSWSGIAPPIIAPSCRLRYQWKVPQQRCLTDVASQDQDRLSCVKSSCFMPRIRPRIRPDGTDGNGEFFIQSYPVLSVVKNHCPGPVRSGRHEQDGQGVRQYICPFLGVRMEPGRSGMGLRKKGFRRRQVYGETGPPSLRQAALWRTERLNAQG
jgi:hypothetical protein